MKKNVKVLSFTLVLMMLLTSMIACAGNKEPEITTPADDGGVSDATTTPEVVLTGPGDAYEKDDLPKDKKWDDEIYLFTWSDQLYWKFEATTETGDTVRDEVYRRKLRLEDTYGITLKIESKSGNWDAKDSFIKTVEANQSEEGITHTISSVAISL